MPDTKELIEIIAVKEKDANTRIQLAYNKYQQELKYEEGYKAALWEIERLIEKDKENK